MNGNGMYCSITGLPLASSADGIWEDGEWISWEWINQQIALQECAPGLQERREDYPSPPPQPKAPFLRELIEKAALHDLNNPGKSSQLWGQIGEFYIAERFGVRLSREKSQGHDGQLRNEFVEIKTITPTKGRLLVRVKRTSNFSLLAIVRVTPNLELDARLLRRDQILMAGEGKFATISWSRACELADLAIL
jgi:hypothetical protein